MDQRPRMHSLWGPITNLLNSRGGSLRSILFAVLIILIVPSVVRAEELSGKPHIVDGDTIKIDGQRIRLHGIDAPETKQTCWTGRYGKPFQCGVRSTRALIEIIGRETITCRGEKRDRYKRLIAKCFIGRIDIGEQLVARGWAFAYRKYSRDYVRAEEAARRLREGLWRHKFEMPWEWRRK